MLLPRTQMQSRDYRQSGATCPYIQTDRNSEADRHSLNARFCSSTVLGSSHILYTMSTGHLKYGLPLRPPTASTALWAHILRQDTQPSTSLSDTPIVVPPTVPLDKNATSMRVLLHDTQANFEKFAIHVAKLIDGVNETKHEIKTTSDLFERDRQTLVGDIIDLGMFIPLPVAAKSAYMSSR